MTKWFDLSKVTLVLGVICLGFLYMAEIFNDRNFDLVHRLKVNAGREVELSGI